MTQPDDTIGAVLARIYDMAGIHARVTTDGSDYRPAAETEMLAAQLGFTKNMRNPRVPRTPDQPLFGFVADQKRADWHKIYRLQTALHVLAMAGADQADVGVLAAALDVELIDPAGRAWVDGHNEQVRRHWLDQAAQEHATAVAAAYEQGRNDALAERAAA